tara:strand:+ start:2797 stop:4722 length:1926 start_codon:yes stop_codon:yes gene_type:complete
MKRFKSLPSKIIFLGILLTASITAFANNKPNVLIYLADDLGYGSINTYGAPENLVHTPYLNQLAEKGVQFNNAYTPASVCTPTRYSMLTGEYSWRSRLKRFTLSKTDYTLIDWDRLSLAKWMQSQGYTTAHVGKWHLGYKAEGPVLNLLGDLSPGPVGVGFDYHFGVPANLEDRHKVYIENNKIWGLRSDKIEPYGSTWYARRKGNVGPYTGYDAPQRVTENVMTMTTDKAVEWLEKQSDEKPFFLYYAAVAVHNPIEPAPELRGSSNCGLYGDFIQEVDHTFGRLVECLREKGMLENTLIIFASDNGGERYASGMPHCEAEEAGLSINGPNKGKKGQIWEGAFKTPLIISHPKGLVPLGLQSNARVSVVDFYATLADYIAGTKALKQIDAPDSISFKKELLNPEKSFFKRAPLILSDREGRKAIHFDHWKYIEAGTGKNNQQAMLFNLKNDPMERHNVLSKYQKVAKKGHQLLEKLVDGDDRLEWDSGGGGYRHANKTEPRSGKYHLELKAISKGTKDPYCYIYKDLKAEPGQIWEASIYAKLAESPGEGKASAQFKMSFIDNNGNKLHTHESARLNSIKSEYEELRIKAKAPKNTTHVRITPVVSLRGENGTVSAYYDDARLFSGESVFESGFETGAVH